MKEKYYLIQEKEPLEVKDAAWLHDPHRKKERKTATRLVLGEQSGLKATICREELDAKSPSARCLILMQACVHTT